MALLYTGKSESILLGLADFSKRQQILPSFSIPSHGLLSFPSQRYTLPSPASILFLSRQVDHGRVLPEEGEAPR